MAKLGDWTRCTTGKIPHLTKAGAVEQLASMRRAGHGRGLNVYRCGRCGCYHIGHPVGSRSKKGHQR